jgi:hypothetical protein
MRGISIGRMQRYLLGNVYRDGATHCAANVRARALQERRKHNAVSMFVSSMGDVYAPDSLCVTAALIRELFPSWHVCDYQFPLPKPTANRRRREEMPTEETTPTVGDIESDILFHVEPVERAA